VSTEYLVTPRVPGVRPQDPPDYDGITFVYVFTQVLTPWTQPGVNQNVTLVVQNSQGFVSGMTIVIDNAGYYEVVSADAQDRLTVMNFGTNYNQPPGTGILPGKITTTSLPGPPGGIGPAGATGPQGAPGNPGPPLIAKGTVATASALPASGNLGDMWVATDTGHSWSWNGSQWIDLGGYQGPPGSTGAQGPQGIAGATGATGAVGATGATGPAGPPGPAGTTVATNTAANFTQPAVNSNVSVTLNSGLGVSTGLILYIQGGGYYSVQSIAGNVATLQNLGYAINSSPGTVINSGASVGGTGPMGPAGAQGPAGPQGVAGTTGSQGAAGPTGAQGPIGATGATGAQGIQGVQGTQGIPGAAGANGVNAFTTSTAGFTVPTVGSTVVVTVDNATWMVVGELLWIAQAGGAGQPGVMQVQSIAGNQVTLLNPST
jgi:hypothetical protein